MKALTKALVILVVASLALCPISLSEDSDAEGKADGLLLYQVNPKDCEGIAVHNYGNTNIDLSDYTISDMPKLVGNEGTMTFSGITVKAGETLVLYSDPIAGHPFLEQKNAIEFKIGDTINGITTTSKFNLSNSGDDVYLIKDGYIVDSVFFGSKTGTDGGWTGGSVKLQSDKWIQRITDVDTDSADDWRTHVTGQTTYTFDPNLKYDAEVVPFLFPDDGGIPIYKELESATESIKIEMYMLTSKNVLALLVDKAEQGVEISILLEQKPLGYSSIDSKDSLFETLYNHDESDPNIRFIGSGDYARYSYDHAKFAIIDGDTTIVTSENWTTDNLYGESVSNIYNKSDNGNRGWGAVIYSEEYAQFMDGVFEADWSLECSDVTSLEEEYPELRPMERDYDPVDTSKTYKTYQAKVTPILSSDTSYDALEYFVSNATERVYSEQQSLGESYSYLTGNTPVSLVNDRAKVGVDTRLIFGDKVDKNLIISINTKSLIKATIMDTPYVHNKGLICDDVTWVSSINWTSNSFENNREACVAIYSADVADFFAKAFLADFEEYYTFDGMQASIVDLKDNYDSGKEIVFKVQVNPENVEYTYLWDFGDGSDKKTTTVSSTVHTPIKDGNFTLKVRITDSSGNEMTVTQQYSVGTPSNDDEGSLSTPESLGDIMTMIEDNLYIVAPIIVIILGAIVAAVRHR